MPAYRLSVGSGEPARPACPACRKQLRWVHAGRRCRGCGGKLGPRPTAVALVGVLVGAGLGWRFGATAALAPFLAVGLLGVLIGAVDLASERLPDVLVAPAIAVALVGLAIAGPPGALGRAALGGVVYAGVYLVLAVLPGGQLGLGDVKLAVLLGVCLGWLGWPVLLAGALLPWLLNAPVAVAMLIRRGRTGSSMPFGPAMLAGAYTAVVLLPMLTWPAAG